MSRDTTDYFRFPHADKSPEEFMDFCVKRVLELYDNGDPEQAFESFFSDVRTHPATNHIGIGRTAWLHRQIVHDGLNKSREDFEASMRGFAF